MLSETMRDEFPGQSHGIGEDELLQRLKQRGVVDNILQQIQFDGSGELRRPATHFTDKENAFKQPPGKKSELNYH